MAAEQGSKQVFLYLGIAFTAMLFMGDLSSRYWTTNVSHVSDTVDHLTVAVGGLASRETVTELKAAVVGLTARLDALPQPNALNSLASRVDQERDDIGTLQGTTRTLQVEIEGLQRAAGTPPYPPLPDIRQPPRR
jgi:hypothetical protein